MRIVFYPAILPKKFIILRLDHYMYSFNPTAHRVRGTRWYKILPARPFTKFLQNAGRNGKDEPDLGTNSWCIDTKQPGQGSRTCCNPHITSRFGRRVAWPTTGTAHWKECPGILDPGGTHPRPKISRLLIEYLVKYKITTPIVPAPPPQCHGCLLCKHLKKSEGSVILV